jgi:hypothetical protein
MEAYAELESGGTCERFAPALAALASGAATSEQMLELRPHLRACTACRATVRDLHLSALRRVRVLGPIPAFGWLWDRLRGGRMPDPGAVAPSHVERIDQLRPIERVRQDVTQLMHRAGNADVTTGIQIAAASGGGRVAALGAIVGLCLSGVGAGTVCLVRGISPLGWLSPDPKPAHVRRAAPAVATAPVRAKPRVSAPPKPAGFRTPSPPAQSPRAPSRAPSRSKPRRTATADPSQGQRPTSQQYAPISPTPRAAASEFAAAPAGGTDTAAAPAAAPVTGGGEFGP